MTIKLKEIKIYHYEKIFFKYFSFNFYFNTKDEDRNWDFFLLIYGLRIISMKLNIIIIKDNKGNYFFEI